jgi:hypothetical protein
MVVGLYSNKFHELCRSHLFYRLSIFYHIKVPQVMKQSTQLRRARRDDRNGHTIYYIWSSGEKVPNGYDLEDSRRRWN